MRNKIVIIEAPDSRASSYGIIMYPKANDLLLLRYNEPIHYYYYHYYYYNHLLLLRACLCLSIELYKVVDKNK